MNEQTTDKIKLKPNATKFIHFFDHEKILNRKIEQVRREESSNFNKLFQEYQALKNKSIQELNIKVNHLADLFCDRHKQNKIICDKHECMACSIKDCPHSEPLHYHHDGCPACSN